MKGRTATETGFRIVSRGTFPEAFLKTVRNQWVIGNNLRRVLDIRIGEDDLRNRTDADPANLAALRRAALNIVRLGNDGLSVRRRLRWAAQSLVCLLKLIGKVASPAVEF